MRWITLTRFAARNPVRVNADAIAFVDHTPRGTNVAFGAGETLRVAETPAEIEQLAAEGTPAPSVEAVPALPWPAVDVIDREATAALAAAEAALSTPKGGRRR